MTLRTRWIPTATEWLPLGRTLCCFTFGCLLALPGCKDPDGAPNAEAGGGNAEAADADADADAGDGDGDGDGDGGNFLP
ncbi:MAG: hypothetical protein ACPHRO_09390, partial [Nannocystaceae bacterium]